MARASSVTVAPRRLFLAKEDKHALQRMGDALRQEILGYFEELTTKTQRVVVDPTQWRLMRSEGDLHAYRETKDEVAQRRRPQSATAARLPPQAAMAARSSQSRVMVTGTIAGTVDDAMLAHAFHDTPSMRAHMVSQIDTFCDCAVLNAIEEPCDSDPYRFSGVVWQLKPFPTGIVRDREGLTLSDMRLSQLSTGERVGVYLCHSILHDDLSPDRDASIIRMDVSIGMVFRQLNATQVQVFMMDYLDAKGALPESFQLQELSKSLLSVAAATDTALNRKLSELLLEEERPGSSSSSSRTSPRQCHCCDRRLGGLFNSSGRTCQLCAKNACGRCLLKRELVADAASDAVLLKPFEFCSACVARTRSLSSLAVARRALRRDSPQGSGQEQ